jgi:hypothetical protein
VNPPAANHSLESHPVGIRWYEKDPDLFRFVTNLEHMPLAEQHRYCQIIVQLADSWREESLVAGKVMNVGAERAMGLLRSQRKQRWYDQDPLVHRAFNSLYLFEDAVRISLSRRLNETIEFIQRYRDLCASYRLPPRDEDIQFFMQQSIRQETERCEAYLADLRNRMQQYYGPPFNAAPSAVDDSHHSMRVRGTPLLEP